MGDEIKKLLEETIKQDLEEIGKMSLGSEERETAMHEIETFVKLGVADKKADWDAYDADEHRRIEEDKNSVEAELRKEQLKNERLRSILDLGKVGISSIAGYFVTMHGIRWIYKFDVQGVLPNREAIKFLPKLKIW